MERSIDSSGWTHPVDAGSAVDAKTRVVEFFLPDVAGLRIDDVGANVGSFTVAFERIKLSDTDGLTPDSSGLS